MDFFLKCSTSFYNQPKKEYPFVDEYIVSPVFNFKDDEDGIFGLNQQYELMPCNYLWTRLAIYWNGEITACCRDYNNKFKLGNVIDDDIKKVWKSEKMMTFRYNHLSNNRSRLDICRFCTTCITKKL